jgi:high-affinity iron transporter
MAYIDFSPNPDQHQRILKHRVYWGAGLGLALSVVIAGVILFIFFTLSNDLWAGAEDLWEGSFSILSS